MGRRRRAYAFIFQSKSLVKINIYVRNYLYQNVLILCCVELWRSSIIDIPKIKKVCGFLVLWILYILKILILPIYEYIYTVYRNYIYNIYIYTFTLKPSQTSLTHAHTEHTNTSTILGTHRYWQSPFAKKGCVYMIPLSAYNLNTHTITRYTAVCIYIKIYKKYISRSISIV